MVTLTLHGQATNGCCSAINSMSWAGCSDSMHQGDIPSHWYLDIRQCISIGKLKLLYCQRDDNTTNIWFKPYHPVGYGFEVWEYLRLQDQPIYCLKWFDISDPHNIWHNFMDNSVKHFRCQQANSRHFGKI